MPIVKSIEQLRRELAQKEQVLNKLQMRRDKLQAKLEGVDKLIAQMLGQPVKGRRGGRLAAAITVSKKAPVARKTRKAQGRGGKALVDYVKQVLANKDNGMRVRDIMTAVKKAGYKSISKDFYTIVAATVRDPKTFTKLARGVYKLA